MTDQYVRMTRLRNCGDERGCSYEIVQEAFGYVGKVEDVHIASIDAGKIRGNHYHIDKRELIVILYSDSFVFAWESSDGCVGEKKEVTGRGCLLVEVADNVCHAIQNVGSSPIYVIVFSPDRYDPKCSGTVVKKIL